MESKASNKKLTKNNTFKRQKFKPDFKKKTPTWKQIDVEIETLNDKYEGLDPSKINEFKDLPLSKSTLDGLHYANYTKPTDIQKQAICAALNNLDILGAAKTGSGKTLAFLVPIMETLYRLKWTRFDGLGALIISPTRELAYQTFQVLKKIGCKHDFSAGLVIGGKDLKIERDSIIKTNIVVCTPGRLLQHMDETYNFTCAQLKVLVLDEADRILDLGFAQTLNAIIENLNESTDRQTLLFSATQTKSIKDLARLSLKNPAYISVHEHSPNGQLPETLEHNYIRVEPHEKINFLFSFIRNHLDCKIIIFFQSCKQVKYVHEIFSKLDVGTNLLALYGSMNQLRRMNIYDCFSRKKNSILLATDLAARGLDFPNVNWVVQADCPTDTIVYTHRSGRTARYESTGQSLLMLTQHESEYFLKELREKTKININEIQVNPKFIKNIELKIQSYCAEDVELKESAKRALMSYLKSLYLINNKKLFSIDSIDTNKLAASYGLSVAPRIRFLQNAQKRANAVASSKNKQQQLSYGTSQREEDEEVQEEEEDSGESTSDESDEEEMQEDETQKNLIDDLFTIKRVYNPNSSDYDDDTYKLNDNDLIGKKGRPLTKVEYVRKLKKRKIAPESRKIEYDEDGEAILKDDDIDDNPVMSGIDLEKARERLKRQDKSDKELFKKRIREKHTTQRLREKEKRREKRGNGGAGVDEDDDEIYENEESMEQDSQNEDSGQENKEEINSFSE